MKKIREYAFLKSMQWRMIASGTAVISGLFVCITTLLLFSNYSQERAGVPDNERIYSTQFETGKLQLRADPQNLERKEQVREIDLQLRQNYFMSKQFIEQGKYNLIAGIIVFLISIHYLLSLHPVLRHKKNKNRNPEEEAVHKTQARRAIYVFTMVLGCSVMGLALVPVVELPSVTQTSVVDTSENFPTIQELQHNWHRFRGYGGLGISSHENIPTYWNEETGEGIAWKTEVPLPGNNSPIIWGDRIFLSGADKEDKAMYCFSADTGDLLWQHSLNDIPVLSEDEPQVFIDTGYAAASMVCDGYRVFAIFADGVIGCCDLDGKRIWAKHLGVPENVYGYSSSLVFHENRVYVQFDQGYEDDDKSSLIALDAKTGELAWQVKRPVASTWVSPLLIDTDENKQLITCAEPWVISYVPETGEELWRAHLLGMDLAPSPIFANGLVLVIQPNETLFAIRPDGRGDVTETHVEWELEYPVPDITSPVAKGHLLFMVSGGYLSCHDLNQNGEMIWEHDFGDAFSASPSIVGEWVYLTSAEGLTYRVKVSPTFERAEQISLLSDGVSASSAYRDNQIIIRSKSFLYGIQNSVSILTP